MNFAYRKFVLFIHVPTPKKKVSFSFLLPHLLNFFSPFSSKSFFTHFFLFTHIQWAWKISFSHSEKILHSMTKLNGFYIGAQRVQWHELFRINEEKNSTEVIFLPFAFFWYLWGVYLSLSYSSWFSRSMINAKEKFSLHQSATKLILLP